MAEKRILVGGLIVIAMLLADRAMAEPTVKIEPACGGKGFTGVITDGEVTAYFGSCATPAGLESSIWTETKVLSEISATPDGSDIIYKVHGTQLTPEMTVAQWGQLTEQLISPEEILGN